MNRFWPPPLTVRAIQATDARAICKLLEENWAVHTRIPIARIRRRLTDTVGFVAEDSINLRGVLLVEPLPLHGGLILCAAVHDNRDVHTILNALLPPVEAKLQQQDVNFVLQIGDAPWLTQELSKFGFIVRDKLITLARPIDPPPPIQPHPTLQIRPVRAEDLPALLTLDKLAFGRGWQKPHSTFREALRRAVIFITGQVDERIVAYGWCDKYGERIHLTRLATDPAYQQTGIGTHMLHHMLQTISQLNASQITLNTQKNNTPAQTLYQRFGFHPTMEEIAVYCQCLPSAIYDKK